MTRDLRDDLRAEFKLAASRLQKLINLHPQPWVGELSICLVSIDLHHLHA
jgi:hypothetical protein